MRKQILFILFLFLFSLILPLAQSDVGILPVETTSPIIETQPGEDVPYEGEGVSMVVEGGQVTYFFLQGNPSINIGEASYGNVYPSSPETYSFLSTDAGGSIIAADLTTAQAGILNFGEASLDVPADTRVVYANGKFELSGTSSEAKIKLPGEDQFANLKCLETCSFSVEGETILGSNFEINNIKIITGGIKIVQDGILLLEDTTAQTRGIEILTSSITQLLVSNKENFPEEYANAIFLGNKNLKAQGTNFNLDFGTTNPYVKIENMDNFQIHFNNYLLGDMASSLIITNRDSQNKIPFVELQGNVNLEDDSMTLKNYQGKTFLKEDNLLSSYTSPIELAITDNDVLKSQKILFTNFNGFSLTSNKQQVGNVLDNVLFKGYDYSLNGLNKEDSASLRYYAESIYPVKASTELRYNYPTEKDFERLSGIKLEITNSQGETRTFENAIILRELIDIYSTLNPETRTSVQKIYLLPEEVYQARYDNNGQYWHLYKVAEGKSYIYNQNEIYLPYQPLNPFEPLVFSTVKHEFAHALDDKNSYFDIWTNRVIEENNEFDVRWTGLIGGKSKMELLDPLILKDKGNFVWKDGTNGPKEGFVRPYGAYNKDEDIATYVGKITSDPDFFKDEGLLEGQANYNPLYKQKIDLLFENNFISQAEYNAIFD